MTTIDTKEQRKTALKSKIAFFSVNGIILLIVIISMFSFLNDYEVDKAAAGSFSYINMFIMMTVCCLEGFAIYFMPISTFYLGRQSGRMKALKEDATFQSTMGITYYRDILKGVSPSTVSILANLKIESHKDAVATLLRLFDKQMIVFENGRMVCAQDNAYMSPDESELYKMIEHGVTSQGLSDWADNRYNDAIKNGYITVGSDEKIRKSGRGCTVGCVTWIVVVMLLGLLMAVPSMLSDFNFIEWIDTNIGEIANHSPDSNGKIHLNLEDVRQMSKVCTILAVLLLVCDLITVAPCWLMFRHYTYVVEKRRGGLYERTQKGNELAEKIAGLQRFIHEFSNLSQVQKEQVVLWNDFLVYAVVLEENDLIVKDIGRLFDKTDIVEFARNTNFR